MQNTVLRDLSVLWAMFHVIFLFVMLFRSRYTRRKTLLAAGAGMGILMILNMVLGWVFGFGFLGKIFLYLLDPQLCVFLYLLCRQEVPISVHLLSGGYDMSVDHGSYEPAGFLSRRR